MYSVQRQKIYEKSACYITICKCEANKTPEKPSLVLDSPSENQTHTSHVTVTPHTLCRCDTMSCYLFI